jgi:hypothetical protein
MGYRHKRPVATVKNSSNEHADVSGYSKIAHGYTWAILLMSACPWLLLFPAADVKLPMTIGHCSNGLFMPVAIVKVGHVATVLICSSERLRGKEGCRCG